MPTQPFSEHFRQIARRYQRVRSLDVRAVRRIAKKLGRIRSPASGLRLLDVGTGTDRYLQAVCAELRKHGAALAWAVGADASPAMLTGFASGLAESNEHAAPVAAFAETLPLADATVDAILTFNAVHHLALDPFLAETARVLCPHGLLVVYTRTPEQNRATIWGQHFPGFAERESRLYTRDELDAALQRSASFSSVRLRTAGWWQLTTLSALLRQARARHYSTFRFYEPEEFEWALATFHDRVRRSYRYPWAIPVRNTHVIAFAKRSV